MNEIWIRSWTLGGIVLLSAGAGVLVGACLSLLLALILAPGSLDEAWATLREGGGRFSAWMNRGSGPRARQEGGK